MKYKTVANTVYKQAAGFSGLVGFCSFLVALVTWEDESLREAATAHTRNVGSKHNNIKYK